MSTLLKVFVWMNLCIIVMVGPAAAQGMTKDIVRPHDDKIEVYKDALREIERQANERIGEISAWKQFYGSVVKSAFDSLVEQAKGKAEEKVKKYEKWLATARAVGAGPKDGVNLPHFGGTTPERLQKALSDARKAVTALNQSISSKALNLHVSFVGWLKDLPGRILGYDEEIKKAQQALRAGTYKIHYPGLGWIDGNALKRYIATEEKAKQAVLATIKKGTFAVYVPGVGIRNRNQVESEIASVEKHIAELRKTAQDGKLSVHRPVFSWKNRTQLDAAIKDLNDWVQRQQAWRSDPAWKLWTYYFSWISFKGVQDRLKAIEKGIADVRSSVNAGEYKVYVSYFGWTHRKGLEAARQALNKSLANPKLTAAAREHVQKKLAAVRKGFADIQKMSALDLVIRAMDKAAASKVLSAMLKLARPQLDSKKLQLAQHQAHTNDFKNELTAALKPYEQRLAVLRKGLDYLP